MLGKVELKLHMPKDMSSKGYNRNKSISKIATKKSLVKQTATLAWSLLRGLLWACNESYALCSQLLHTLGTPEVPVCNSEPELHPLIDESSDSGKAATAFLELEQKISASYTHFLSNLEAFEVPFTNE